VPALLRKIEEIEPDVVHGQAQDRHGLAAVLCGRPHVVTPHGVGHIESTLKIRGWYDFPARRRKRKMDGTEREIFERAGDMIIISRYLVAVYADMLTATPHLIENPIDPNFFDVERKPEPGRLLFVGTVVPRKQVLDLVNGMGKLKEITDVPAHLRIVGPAWDAAYESEVKNAIESGNLGEHITLTGGVSQEDLVEEFRRADALVLASREETAPQVIAQAFACGLPVIASRAGGVPYMVRDNETALLFDPGDIPEFASQVKRYLESDDLKQQMSATVRAEAPQRFHPDHIAEQTLEVYRRIVQEA
jgi:glycosyltransferase involved in cell wall biosynthesis